MSHCCSVLRTALAAPAAARPLHLQTCRLAVAGCGRVRTFNLDKRRYKRCLAIRPIHPPETWAPTLAPIGHSIQALAPLCRLLPSAFSKHRTRSQSIAAPAAMIDLIFSGPQSPTLTLALWSSQQSACILSTVGDLCLTNDSRLWVVKNRQESVQPDILPRSPS